jgi:hypothetical protein
MRHKSLGAALVVWATTWCPIAWSQEPAPKPAAALAKTYPVAATSNLEGFAVALAANLRPYGFSVSAGGNDAVAVQVTFSEVGAEWQVKIALTTRAGRTTRMLLHLASQAVAEEAATQVAAGLLEEERDAGRLDSPEKEPETEPVGGAAQDAKTHAARASMQPYATLAAALSYASADGTALGPMLGVGLQHGPLRFVRAELSAGYMVGATGSRSGGPPPLALVPLRLRAHLVPWETETYSVYGTLGGGVDIVLRDDRSDNGALRTFVHPLIGAGLGGDLRLAEGTWGALRALANVGLDWDLADRPARRDREPSGQQRDREGPGRIRPTVQLGLKWEF